MRNRLDCEAIRKRWIDKGIANTAQPILFSTAVEDVRAMLAYIEWLEAENESLNEQNEQITQDAQEHAQRQHYEHHRALEAARISRDNAIEETRRFRENHRGTR